jgi:hypothetical protein
MKYLLLLLLAVPCFGQDRGNTTELKGSKCFVIGDAHHIKAIEKVVKKLTFVSARADADFFLEYRTIEIKYVSSLDLPIETGQLDAYYFRDKDKIVVWSESTSSGGSTAAKLAKRFIKALN